MQYYQPEFECASQEEIRTLQSERLTKQMRHAYDNIPYYKELCDKAGVTPEDIQSVDDLKKLPFTYKKDLRDTYPYGLFAVPMEDVVRVHASSGTTGKQIVVGYTKDDLDIWDDIIARQLVAIGADRGDIIQIGYGYGLFTGGLGVHGGATKLGCTVVPASSGNTARQLTIMKDFGTTVLCCTPSYAAFLGEALAEHGMTTADLKLKSGIFGAEAWSEEMRKGIEKSLGIDAFDIYGLTEIMGPGVGYECSAKSGMHINEDHFIVEIINPDTGELVPDGEQGEIVFSCITRQAFPLLRYRTRDIGVIHRGTCECGRTFVKMSKPMGRSDDMLIIRGVNVFPSQIETVLLGQGYPANYQIVVDRVNFNDTFEVMVEMTPEMFNDKMSGIEKRQRELRDGLKNMLGIGAKVSLVAPKTIVRSEGKAVRVIDKRKI